MGILTLRFIWRLFRIRLRPKPSPAVRPRSAPTPFVLGCEPKGACLREGPSEGHIVVSLCSELLLGFKLVRVASGIEDGVALQAISSGLVASALGEDDVFVTCPLRNAASELVIRKPTDAAKAASVVCAASGFPAAGFFVPLCAFAPVWLPLLERQSLMAAKARGEVGAEMQLCNIHMYEDLLNALLDV